ncbi:MAG: LCP family protein [Chloroflexi bacterium]|nr:LCP family protein [Chloroflexota bacterium]
MAYNYQNRRSQKNNGLSPLSIIGFILLIFFLCGGVFFGYQIYDTVRETVIALGLPDIGDMPPVLSGVIAQPTGQPAAPNIIAGERVNFLIMGIDRRATESCPCRSDTMMLATLDPKTATAGLVTIPRDLYVPIPGYGEQRINTALFIGARDKLPGGGPALAKKTIEYNFGRQIHYYVIVDFNGFRRVVDTLGGIEINVPKAIDDPQYPTENYGVQHVHFNAGLQRMNGEQALQYARTRHADSDFGRSKRQIQVLMAIRDKALRLDIITKLPSLLQSMWGTLETDLKPTEVLALAQAASKVKTENIKTAVIDQTMTVEYVTSTGADVLWFDRVKIGQLMDQIIPQSALTADLSKQVAQEAARITVVNGTLTPQLAERTTKFLQAQGYQITAYGNADRFDYAQTVLIDYSGNKSATITALAKLFNVSPENIRRTTNVKGESDIRIILGANWIPPAEKTQP